MEPFCSSRKVTKHRASLSAALRGGIPPATALAASNPWAPSEFGGPAPPRTGSPWRQVSDHRRAGPQPLPSLTPKVCEVVKPGPHSLPPNLPAACSLRAQNAKRSERPPSQSRPGTAAAIYRLVPPACERHGDHQFVRSGAARDWARARGAVLGTPGSLCARPGPGWHRAGTERGVGGAPGPAPPGWLRAAQGRGLFLRAAAPCGARGPAVPGIDPLHLAGAGWTFTPILASHRQLRSARPQQF